MSVSETAKLNAQRGLALIRRMGANVAPFWATLRRAPRGAAGLWLGSPGTAAAAVVGTIAILAVVTVTADAWAVTVARGAPSWFFGAFEAITDFGKSGWVLVPTGCLLLAIAAVASPGLGRIGNLVLAALAVRLSFIFLAVGVPGLFVTIVKRLIGRARPFVGGPENPYLYHPFVWRPDYASMPSGHATTAFATAIAVGAVWPRSRPYVWTYALAIALSRVVITAHHPSDVLAGAVVGAVGAILVRHWFATRRLGFAVGGDGGVHAMPGPSWRRIKAIAGRLLHQ